MTGKTSKRRAQHLGPQFTSLFIMARFVRSPPLHYESFCTVVEFELTNRE